MQNLDNKINYSSLINSMPHIIWFYKFNLLPTFSSYSKYVLQKYLSSICLFMSGGQGDYFYLPGATPG